MKTKEKDYLMHKIKNVEFLLKPIKDGSLNEKLFDDVINEISTLRKESVDNLDNAILTGDYYESDRLNTEVMAYTNVLNILRMTYKERIKAINEFRETVFKEIKNIKEFIHPGLHP